MDLKEGKSHNFSAISFTSWTICKAYTQMFYHMSSVYCVDKSHHPQIAVSSMCCTSYKAYREYFRFRLMNLHHCPSAYGEISDRWFSNENVRGCSLSINFYKVRPTMCEIWKDREERQSGTVFMEIGTLSSFAGLLELWLWDSDCTWWRGYWGGRWRRHLSFEVERPVSFHASCK